MKITKICSHHTGPTSPTNPLSSSKDLTEGQIENAHKDRGFNISFLGWHVGYNVIIYPDGTWKQYRLLGEQTAASTGSNFDTFHICMAGNFTSGVDSLSLKQIETLTMIIRALVENKPQTVGIKLAQDAVYSFSAYDIYPHRILQPNHTTCHGNALGDNLARSIAFEYLREKNKGNPFIYKMLSTFIDFFNKRKFGRIKVGVKDYSDDGIIYK